MHAYTHIPTHTSFAAAAQFCMHTYSHTCIHPPTLPKLHMLCSGCKSLCGVSIPSGAVNQARPSACECAHAPQAPCEYGLRQVYISNALSTRRHLLPAHVDRHSTRGHSPRSFTLIRTRSVGLKFWQHFPTFFCHSRIFLKNMREQPKPVA